MRSAFDLLSPTQLGPVVVEVPHSGLELDALAARTLPPEAANARVVLADSDLGAADVWRRAVDEGATVIVATMSRYVIDLNTEPRVPTPYEDKLPPQLRDVRHTSVAGLRWSEPRPYSDEVEERIRQVFEPYHAAVSRALDAAQALNGRAIVISAHTYPTHRASDPDVVLGTRHGLSADAHLRDLVATVFRSHGLSVALEAPFPGGYALTRHARPDARRLGIQIEFARRLVCARSDAYDLDATAVADLAEVTREVVRAMADRPSSRAPSEVAGG